MDKEPIKPFAVYTPNEAAKVANCGRNVIYDAVKSGELESKRLGKGWKITGENLLRYLGSVTYQAPSQTDQNYQSTAGVPAQNGS